MQMGPRCPSHGIPAPPSPPVHAARIQLSAASLFLSIGALCVPSAAREGDSPVPLLTPGSPLSPSSPAPVPSPPLLPVGFDRGGVRRGRGAAGSAWRWGSLALTWGFGLHFCMPLFFCLAATVEAVEAREGMARTRREAQIVSVCACAHPKEVSQPQGSFFTLASPGGGEAGPRLGAGRTPWAGSSLLEPARGCCLGQSLHSESTWSSEVSASELGSCKSGPRCLMAEFIPW